MRLGFQFQTFNQPPDRLGASLGSIARAAEDAGFEYVLTMDHFFQLPMIGPVDEPMTEAYTTLGFLAAHTSRVRLGTLVSGPMSRHPGVLIKQVTTLDVLSGGRALLGIGASWFEREHLAYGVPFPPQSERFERLEEILQIAHQMWRGNREPYAGQHYQLDEPVNSPAALSRPHPPILVGGGGERRTLRLVAQYADACNLDVDDIQETSHKLSVLREHCAEIGRPFDDIERTAIIPIIDLGERGEHVNAFVDRLGTLADIGIQAVFGTFADSDLRRAIEIAGRDVVPQASGL
ncbi:MAG: LLM class F420-dependent oxidoreductase [Thermomicrobiales bacterium]